MTCENCKWWLPNFDPEETAEILDDDGGEGTDWFWGCRNDKASDLVDGGLCTKPTFSCSFHEPTDE